MSMEAMKTLAQVEGDAAAQKKAAEVAAGAQVAEAIRAGAALKAEAKVAAEAEAKELLMAVEEDSKSSTATLLAEATANCEATKEAARGRLAQAAAHIAERVVNI